MMFKREEGTTLVEALMAMVVLVLGVIGTFTTFDGIQRLGMFGEKKQSATRYVQSEMEQMRNLGWTNLKMSATPATFSDSRGTLTGSTYAPPNGVAQTLRISASPGTCTSTTCVNPGPETWTYGSASGFVYRYVTSSRDTLCGSACPAGGTDHVRVTVAVTINGPNAPKVALVSSTIVIDPTVAPSGATQNVNPVTSTGGSSIGASTGTTYFFTDTPAGASYVTPSAAHTTRNTVGGSGVPDLLQTGAPGTPGSGSQIAVSYSTDNPPRSDGGLGLTSSATCSGTGATTSHRWVTPVLNASAAVTATGNAALTMPTSLLDADAAAGAPGKLCIKIYSVALNGSNQVSSSTLLGSEYYQLSDWPETTELISFPFRYLATGTTTSLAAGRRLMAEITADSASSTGIALVYDHPNFPASIQLETQ